MPFRITSPYAVRGIARQFVIPGPYIPVLGDELYAVQDVGDFAGRSPFAARRIGGQTAESAAGGVGIFSSLLVRPGAGTLFVLEEVIVSAAGNIEVDLRLCRPADVAALTIGTAVPFGCLSEPVAGSGFIPTLAATLTDVSRNTTVTGGLFGRVRVAANQHQGFRFPRGVVLCGEDAQAATSFLLTNIAANTAIRATCFGTEYVAPPAQIP